jgi:hypothetical protein
VLKLKLTVVDFVISGSDSKKTVATSPRAKSHQRTVGGGGGAGFGCGSRGGPGLAGLVK